MSVAKQRTRKYFIGANWKSNGSTQMVKEMIQYMINEFEYDTNIIGN
jgi:triosephosphate isomerase